MTADFEKLLKSYVPFAEKLGIPLDELRDALLQVAKAGVAHKNRCLNCALSRADRRKNEESVERDGMILIQARVCVLGMNSNSCGNIRKPIISEGSHLADSLELTREIYRPQIRR
jgi:hypothetical protein